MAVAMGHSDILVRAKRAELPGLREFVRQLDEIIERDSESTRLVGSHGEGVEIPPAALRALKRVVEGMAAGLTLSLVPHGKELTTQEAADLLHVSRPHLVKLLDQGNIPHHRVGTHRRVKIDDVLAFAAERTERRRQELRALTRLSQEAEGGYA